MTPPDEGSESGTRAPPTGAAAAPASPAAPGTTGAASNASAGPGAAAGADAVDTEERTAVAGARGAASTRPPSAGAAAALVGQVLSGRYRIEALIGEGGMGAVYQAEHVLMHKRFAIKVLHPEMVRMPEVVARFEREAMAAAHIEHPNVASATDFGKLDDGSFFLVLEYVEGTSLRDLLVDAPLEVGRALHITMQIASALARAHALGIVHRDLKPENVMLVERDQDRDFVKVLDFGIAKVPVGEIVKSDPSVSKGQVLTQLGMIYGTPEYMAPEQALGQDVDARADLYALGVMLFEMLTGVRPFDAESKVTLLGQKVTRRAPALSEKVEGMRFAAAVEGLVARLLEREAHARFADARSLLEAIESLAMGEAVTLPPVAHFRTGRVVVSPAMTPAGGMEKGASSADPLIADAAPHARFGPEPSLPEVLIEAIREKGGPLVEAVAGRMPARLAALPPQVVLVASAAVLLVVLLAMIGISRRAGPAVRIVDGGIVAAPPAVPLMAPKIAPTAELAAAVAAGPQALVELSARFPEDPAVFRALARADADRKNYTEATQAIEKLVSLDRAAADESEIGQIVLSAAEGPADAADAAFELLEKGLGPRGVDLLYEMSQTRGLSSKLLARVKQSLAKPEVKSLAAPALSVLMEIKSASGCEAKRALLGRARDEGDARLLPVLRALNASKGCGFLGLADCWGCMHHDGSLGAAIAAIENRANGGSAPGAAASAPR